MYDVASVAICIFVDFITYAPLYKSCKNNVLLHEVLNCTDSLNEYKDKYYFVY